MPCLGKRCRYAVPARTVTKKPCLGLLGYALSLEQQSTLFHLDHNILNIRSTNQINGARKVTPKCESEARLRNQESIRLEAEKELGIYSDALKH